MEELLERARSLFEGEIDFEGQRLADFLTTALLSVTGIIAFLIGYVYQNIYYTLYGGLTGSALTFLLITPPWPFFNKHPLKWLPARTGYNAGIQGVKIEVNE